jgi:hypothetical protein
MNSFPRLLCLASLATAAAFAQTNNSPSADPTLAALASPPDLQVRSPQERTVLPTATVLRLKLNRAVSTTTAKPGEQLTATLTQPVQVDGATVVPAGATVNCLVMRAHGASRFRGKPSLSIKAISVQTPTRGQLNFTASVVDTATPRKLDVDQEGRIRGVTPNPMDKIEAGALAGTGAIAGAVIAGPEGLLIGTATGAAIAAGHIIVKHRELTLPAGTELIFELDAPATLATHPQMGGMQ